MSKTLLTVDDIRITVDSIGANGRAVRSKPFKVFVGHHGVLDDRGRMRRFGSRKAARQAVEEFIAAFNAHRASTAAPGLVKCEFCDANAKGRAEGGEATCGDATCEPVFGVEI